MTEVLPFNTSPLPLKLRVEDFLVLDASGAFQSYEKTELLDGEVFFVNAQHRPHALIKADLYDALRDALKGHPSAFRPLAEASIALTTHSAPEPDIVLTSEPRGEGLIPFHSVALIVEVSDTTLADDLKRKLPIYARAGVPEYWVVDVNTRVIHQMWGTSGESCAQRKNVPLGHRIRVATIDNLFVDAVAS